MDNLEELSPELQEAVRQYRNYGQAVFDYDQKVRKFDREEDYRGLHEAIGKRNFWQLKIKELIKGREKELNWLLIG
jgi:transcriptional regulator NrdR family protein